MQAIEQRVDSLYQLKGQKLASQKALSDEFHEIVHKLAISSTQKRKNLAAAIAVAKQPGYFEYYEPPAEIKCLESGNTLKRLAVQISKLNREIEQITEDIQQETDTIHRLKTAQPMELSKISQWFDVYGKPNRVDDDRLTKFVPNGKVYGGTNHHRSFKTVSLTMKKGRIIN